MVDKGLLVLSTTLGYEAVGMKKIRIVGHNLKHATSRPPSIYLFWWWRRSR